MAKIRVVGFDPSLNNWGIATGSYDTVTGIVAITSLAVTQPEVPSGKRVRQNSKDIAVANQLATAAMLAAEYAEAIFVEVPVGSQTARAMASYGVCVGILGALRADHVPFYEVNPIEVKLISVGSKTATKNQMIDWATEKHPYAPWPRRIINGQKSLITSKAEHMADAIAAIYAGIATAEFQQMLRILNSNDTAAQVREAG